MLDEVRRLALFTSGIAELTRNRAEKIVRSWGGGDLSNARASTMVRQLVQTSKENRSELLSLIRSEIKNQARTVGLADGRELERLERRVERLEEQLKKERATGGTAKTTARKSSSKKSTRKKTGAGKKKTTAGRKKTTARGGSSGSSSARTPAPGSPGRPLGRS